MWTPDVYQGAPSPITAFMSSATKVAGFAAFLRIFLVAFPLYRTDWRPIIMALATVTLVVGTVAAVVQTDLKRALAYSSIANAGYVLIGFAAASVDDRAAAHRGLEAALFYLFTYTFMTIGAFAVVTLVGRRSHDARHGFDQYRGLARSSPVLAGFLTFFLLAQAGVPFTGGFIAKLQVFGAAIDAREYWLALVGVLSAVVLAFFYLRVIVVTFAGDDEAGEAPPARARPDRRRRGGRARGHRRHGAPARDPARHLPALRPRRRLTHLTRFTVAWRSVSGRASDTESRGQPTSASRRQNGRRSWRRRRLACSASSSACRGQVVGVVHEPAGTGEVEQLAIVDGRGEHHDLDALGHVAQLEVEALLAADGEGADGDVDRGAQRAVHEVAGDVHHVDPVDRPGQGVPQRDGVDDGAVDQGAAVVADGRVDARQRGAGEQRGLERAAGEHHLVAGVEVGGHHPQAGSRAPRRWRGCHPA